MVFHHQRALGRNPILEEFMKMPDDYIREYMTAQYNKKSFSISSPVQAAHLR